MSMASCILKWHFALDVTWRFMKPQGSIPVLSKPWECEGWQDLSFETCPFWPIPCQIRTQILWMMAQTSQDTYSIGQDTDVVTAAGRRQGCLPASDYLKGSAPIDSNTTAKFRAGITQHSRKSSTVQYYWARRRVRSSVLNWFKLY